MAAVTDSGQEITARPDKPGISNLLAIYSAITNLTVSQIERRYQHKNYGQFKSELAEEIIKFLAPIQDRYRIISQDQETLAKILAEGKRKAQKISQKTLTLVYQKVGLR